VIVGAEVRPLSMSKWLPLVTQVDDVKLAVPFPLARMPVRVYVWPQATPTRPLFTTVLNANFVGPLLV